MYRHLKEKNSSSGGFTLTELLIVVALVAILAALVAPAFAKSIQDSNARYCEANRRSCLDEIIIELSLDPNADTGRILLLYQDKCPNHGNYSLITNRDGEYEIYCTKHSTDIVQDLMAQYQDILDNFLDKEKYPDYPYNWWDNDTMRRVIYKRNGGWPILTYQGKSYYIQPYAGRGWAQPLVFARANGNADPGWYVPFLYYNGRWYTGNAYSITGCTPGTEEQWLADRGWTALSEDDYTISPPKKDS